MKKFSLALLAMATALAISPAAKADTIEAYSSFTVSGVIVPPPSSDPTLTGVVAEDGSGTFSDITVETGSAVSYSLNSGIVGDTFTVTPGDGQTITFTVLSDTVGGGPLDDDAYGIGTITDTGTTDYTEVTDAAWSETVNETGNISFTFDAAVTPEPSSLVLLGTGLLGLAFVAFRKAKPARQAMNLSL